MKNKVTKNHRNWFFFALKIAPLVIFALAVHQQGAQDLLTNFNAFMQGFRFDLMANVLDDVFQAIEVAVPSFVVAYSSYLLAVLFVQIMYDVLSFLPEFCRGCFERGTNL